eukprot:12799597-Ditylum_brightwellii.AAC.1
MMITMVRMGEIQDQDGSNILIRVWTFDPGEIKAMALFLSSNWYIPVSDVEGEVGNVWRKEP